MGGGFYIVPVVLLIFGAGCLAAGLRSLRQARKVKYWPVRAGELVKCEVRREEAKSGGRRAGRIVYELDLKYLYEVDGRKLTGSRYRLNEVHSGNHLRCYELVQRLREQRSIEVFVNPANPEESYLTDEVDFNDYFVMTVGFLFLLSGSAFVVLAQLVSFQKP